MQRVGAESDSAAARNNATIAGVILGLVFIPIGFGMSITVGITGILRVPFALGVGVAVGVAVRTLSYGVARAIARGIAAFLYPSGASVPYEATFSAHDAKEVAGNVAGAIDAYEATIRDEPGNVRALRQAAELYVRAGNPARAAELFVDLRRVSLARDAELYATQRLADLYLGALGDEGKALVELRRLVERFPGTREGAGALIALRRIKDARATDAPPHT